MEQIIKHFSPALIALAVGLLLVGIMIAILATDGPVAQAFETGITSSLTTLQNAMPK